LAFSSDGKLIASGGYDNAVRVWNAATGQELWVKACDTAACLAVAFSPDGKTLTAVGTRSVTAWDIATGEMRPGRWDPERDLYVPAFSPDGGTLAVACRPLPDSKEREDVVCLVDTATSRRFRSSPCWKERSA
jgi:WD40 repeat protein